MNNLRFVLVDSSDAVFVANGWGGPDFVVRIQNEGPGNILIESVTGNRPISIRAQNACYFRVASDGGQMKLTGGSFAVVAVAPI